MPTQHNQFIYIIEVVLQYNFTLLRNFWIGRGKRDSEATLKKKLYMMVDYSKWKNIEVRDRKGGNVRVLQLFFTCPYV